MKIVKMQGPVVRGTEVIRFHRSPLQIQFQWGLYKTEGGGSVGTVASIKVGSPKLQGAGAPRAGSEAHWTTGHGARGRTGLARRRGGGGGAEPRCGAPGVTHSRGLPPWPAAPPQPQPVPVTCTSLKDVWAIPPPARRPWRRSARGPSPRSSRKDKRAIAPPQQARTSTSHNHGRGNPKGQVEDESSC